jgi:hypothetical protein
VIVQKLEHTRGGITSANIATAMYLQKDKFPTGRRLISVHGVGGHPLPNVGQDGHHMRDESDIGARQLHTVGLRGEVATLLFLLLLAMRRGSSIFRGGFYWHSCNNAPYAAQTAQGGAPGKAGGGKIAKVANSATLAVPITRPAAR